MLEFLDSMGVGRGSVYSRILERLMEKILSRIPSLSADEREGLLANSLPYAHVYELRPIVHKALFFMKQQRMPNQLVSQFPRKFKDQDLYLPDWAKYQVWEHNRDYGLRQLREVVVRYIRSFERGDHGVKTGKNGDATGAGKSKSSSSSVPSLSKSEEGEGGDPLTELVEAGQYSGRLYHAILGITRGGFKQMDNYNYCRLRLDLLLGCAYKLRGKGNVNKDSCQRLAMVLKDCRSQRQISCANAERMLRMISEVPSKHPVLGDMAMILAHPEIRMLLRRGIVRLLGAEVSNRRLPNECKEITALSKLLLLSHNARTLMTSEDFPKPKMQGAALNVFYTAIAQMMAAKLLGETMTIKIGMLKVLSRAIKTSGVAQELTMAFLARAARMLDDNMIRNLLPIVAKLKLTPDEAVWQFISALNTWKKRLPSKLKSIEDVVRKWGSRCGVAEKIIPLFGDEGLSS
eukprot:CAMPEP_0185271210 /NCGR_PEP_ID=MMETSP1359-20130426/44212_1 /TAXON_ID=552665 /ORGANISM="Bigelowiella longifila, Strain CCMP242" /LENGTH=460 /DNA_ID=CAMNT_0027863075 /DNA_START=212 /DNA_END=1594 /DNA_ORIENTATION=-